MASLALAQVVQGSNGSAISRMTFMQIPHWQDDRQDEAIKAFQASCTALARMPADKIYGEGLFATEAGVWQKTCEEASLVGEGDRIGARAFFERMFVPYKVSYEGSFTGKFTGYYEPLVHGSWTSKPGYNEPVYSRPQDLEEGKTYPLTRRDIDNGALAGHGLEQMFVDNPVDLFFMQVQGSGRVLMDTGETVSLRFAGKNNQPYTAIGKVLIQQGALTAENVSAPAIRDWLTQHPDDGRNVMQQNASYVFFNVEKEVSNGPVGAQGVVLTPERSLAVDTSFIPLGMPLYLITALPQTSSVSSQEYDRLMIAQDKGTAIKGAVRGDVFFGFGERAEALAGNMKGEGEYIALVPEKLSRELEGKLD